MGEKYKIGDQDRLYFVTFAVVDWVDVFTRREYKDVIVESLKFCQKEKGLIINGWRLMSNHIHLIVGRKADIKIEDIIRDFKKFTSVSICRAIENNRNESRREWMLDIFRKEASKSRKHQNYCFWQDSYHPIVLDTNKRMDQKLDYIHENPVKEGIVFSAEDYVYSSASDYAGGRGLLPIDFIE